MNVAAFNDAHWRQSASLDIATWPFLDIAPVELDALHQVGDFFAELLGRYRNPSPITDSAIEDLLDCIGAQPPIESDFSSYSKKTPAFRSSALVAVLETDSNGSTETTGPGWKSTFPVTGAAQMNCRTLLLLSQACKEETRCPLRTGIRHQSRSHRLSLLFAA